MKYFLMHVLDFVIGHRPDASLIFTAYISSFILSIKTAFRLKIPTTYLNFRDKSVPILYTLNIMRRKNENNL